MAITIEIFENKVSKGSFDFEAAPRLGETLQIKGKSGAWEVMDVRHFAVPDGPAQLQIAIKAAAAGG